MYLFAFKLCAAASIFILTLITGFLPSKLEKHNSNFLCLGDAFASGVFLSAALIHLLPDADLGFRHILGNNCYPFAQLLCLSTFIILLMMERGIFLYGEKHFIKNTRIAPFFLILLLTIHSLVEGAAIGVSMNLAEGAIIFFAVIAHKGSESFALAANLHRYNLSTKTIHSVIPLFSLMTPIGLFVASIVTNILQTNSGNTISSVFSAIAAGTFLYLGTEHLIEGKKSFEDLGELIALICGISLMALVAVWL